MPPIYQGHDGLLLLLAAELSVTKMLLQQSQQAGGLWVLRHCEFGLCAALITLHFYSVSLCSCHIYMLGGIKFGILLL